MDREIAIEINEIKKIKIKRFCCLREKQNGQALNGLL